MHQTLCCDEIQRSDPSKINSNPFGFESMHTLLMNGFAKSGGAPFEYLW